jgi:lipoprotein-anchoring transpeptidase ErfK/SrfK
VPGILLRRLIGGAAILAVIVAMGIVTWFAWTAWLRAEGLVAETVPDPIQTPQPAELSVGDEQPALELAAIVPEEQAIALAATATPTPNPIQPKEIIQGAGDSRPRWTATPPPTQTPSPTPAWAPTFVSPISDAALLKPIGLFPNERWIDVNLATQSLVAFEGDTPVFETLVSTGKVQYPTVMGQFRIWLRFEKQDMDGRRLGYGYYLKDVPYVQYFYQDYALHGTFWHTNFGRQMSHGCVNLSPADSEWLYNFTDYGTLVNVHE